MGDISEHFSRRDFICRCGTCQNEFKISLTLIGVLEMIRTHFNKRVEIMVGHHCEEENARLGGVKKSYHVLGKAARIIVSDTSPEEVFRFIERIPQVQGLALDSAKKQVYLDVRDKAPHKWVIEGSHELELTPEVRAKYNLGEPQEQLAAF
jgi:zinc D-Ala-D-Ala carboxypeptidase